MNYVINKAISDFLIGLRIWQSYLSQLQLTLRQVKDMNNTIQ